MRRRVLTAGAATLLTAISLPALAVADTVGSTRLTITPAHPRPRSNVVVGFVQPTISDRLSDQAVDETLQVTGRAQRGCASGEDRSVPTLPAGSRMREVLAPARMIGRQWCPGVHQVTLTVATTLACPVGVALHICPQYVVTPTTVATASFRVR